MKLRMLERPARILIVDDRLENLLALEAILEPLQVPLVRASSGDAALSALLGGDFALVLLDVMMPDLDGLETARLMKQRERSAHIPIIFITALSREAAYVFKGYSHGAVDYLIKPIDPEILRAKASVFIDFHRRGEKLRIHAAELADREEHIRLLVDASSEPLYGVTPEGLCSFANAPCARLLGYDTPEELIGKDMHALTHSTRLDGTEFPADECALHVASRLGKSSRDDDDFCWRADRVPVPVEARTNPILREGTIEGAAVSVTDLRERRALQAQLLLEARNAAVGTLVEGVAHEMNNPLAYVISNLDFANEELKALESHPRPGELEVLPRLREVQRSLIDARRGAERVRLVIRDLKTFSHDEDLQQTAVDVQSVLLLALKMASREVERRARLSTTIGPLPFIAGNAAKLGQVFLNLIANAGQAIEEGNPQANAVRVVARADQSSVVIEVSDSGSGIPPLVRAHIFDPFFTTKSQGKGRGLGLFICHGIVTAHGGRIEVESEPGKGSTFRVVLPVGETAPPVGGRGRATTKW
jgi:signal transduction histidine kinase/FixJ family two-component response regulator